jgi:N-acetylmuramoyl-L-alanine amidase
LNKLFRSSLLAFALPLATTSIAAAKPLVALDAAHGGTDSGIQVDGQVEKDWNRRFALALEKALEAQGMDVVQIRKNDATLSLEERSQAINNTQASAVVVIHADRSWTDGHQEPLLVVEPPTQAVEFEGLRRWGGISPSQYRLSLKLAEDVAASLGIEPALNILSDSRGTAGERLSDAGRIFCLPHQSLRYVTLPAVVLTPLFLNAAPDVKKFSNDAAMADFAAKAAQGIGRFVQAAP